MHGDIKKVKPRLKILKPGPGLLVRVLKSGSGRRGSGQILESLDRVAPSRRRRVWARGVTNTQPRLELGTLGHMTSEDPQDQAPTPAGSPAHERRGAADRRRRRGYRFYDRRSGFQRRTTGEEMGIFRRAIYGLRARPVALVRVLAAVNVLNVVDFLLTLLVLDAGGREANPILRPLISLSPWVAGLFKLVVVLAATLLVWKSRFYALALITAVVMLALFTCLVLYDLVLVALVR